MIHIHSLSKRYHQQSILDQLELTIPTGTIFALLGPNGSGKTTLLKALLGLVHPAAGATIRIDGHSVIGTHTYKQRISYMPQVPRFPAHLTVRELVALFEDLRNTSGPHQTQLIDELEMAHFWNKPVGQLSGGMVQKVNLLQCFMFDSSLFILDEPTSGLDPRMTFYFKRLIRAKKAAGATVLLTSHIMAEVEELADTLALLIDGRIHTVAAPAAIKAREGVATLEEALYRFWSERV